MRERAAMHNKVCKQQSMYYSQHSNLVAEALRKVRERR